MTQPPPPPPNQPPAGPPASEPPQQPQPSQPPEQDQPSEQPQPSQQPQLSKQPQDAAPQGPPAQSPPPPGGFGAPTPPQPAPAQGPGYGYPQSPPAPQPPQPGYGYPGQPAPYGRQPPYGGQPPAHGQPSPYGQQYGYQPPTAPMHPEVVPGTGGGRKINSQLVIIVAAVAAIALIIGGGVWYASSGGKDDGGKNDTASSSGGTGGRGDGEGGTSGGEGNGKAREKVPSSTSAKVLFQLPAPEVKGRQLDSVQGSWLTDSVYVKAGVYKIVGYDPDSGRASWTLPLDGQTCAASREVTDDGIAVVVHEEKKRNSKGDHQPCTQVTAFQVDDGKQLWSRTVEISGSPVVFTQVTLSGSTVAAGGYYGGAAFDAKTGKSLWAPKVSECVDLGYAGGPQLVAVRKCGAYGDESYEVQLLDPKTGSSRWSYKLPSGIDNAKVISTEPVVFGADSGEITASGATDVFSLDDGGKLLTKITLADGKYKHDCDVGKVWNCKGITVGNDRLYVPTKDHDGTAEYSQTNEIVSFSLATGKSTGDRIDAGDGYSMFPIRMDGPNLLAYKDGPYGKGAQVVSVDGSSLKVTKLLETPASEQVLNAISGMVPETSEMLYTGGRLFMGRQLVSKPYSADKKEYTALGFGAK